MIGVFCLLFAHMAGRVLVDFRKGRTKQSRLIAWLLRTVVCAAAMIFPRRTVDNVAIVVWLLAAVSFAAGVWAASRSKKEEDLSRSIFPDES